MTEAVEEVVEHRLVTTPAALEEIVDAAITDDSYAVDTEFHRERTYFPKVALVQLASPTAGIALIDPLAVDLAPLARLLDGPGTCLMHASNQDLEVLQRACGTVPSKLFDTQLAAGFVGFSTPSLSLLAERILGVHLPKASRLTDWLQRPLGDAQQTYAAADVAHLHALTDALCGELENSGRLAWAEEECEDLRTRDWGSPDPTSAWLKLKESRQLKGKSRAVARAVAGWRERRAAELDIPARHVLPDLAVVGIAMNPPSSSGDLRKLRGVDERHSRGDTANAILDAVREGLDAPPDTAPHVRRDDVDRDQRPAVALASAWLSQLGRELRIDTTLLATRSDLSAFLNGDSTARLANGWRNALLGEPIRALVAGEFAIAFDGKGGLELEERSGKPVTVDLPLPTAPWARG
ncbi:MAG TPA: HRDC domain-containing protein [Acidimicrobiales bacterium]|nr:HRDC domain-containing protein [Acidimicrobiales bacterium]